MAIAEPTPTPVRHATLRLREISEWLEDKSSAYAWRWAGAFIAIVFLVSLVRASRAKMWIDELYTYYSSHQPSAAGVVNAIREGCDGAPPAYALIVRALRPVLGGGVIDLRVPAVLGFCLMCICVFAFVYRRIPALYAGVAMLFACDSALYFATEGRAYGLVLGLVALSLVCWQMAAEGRHRVAALSTFVVCMWVATALHYYSILLLMPLFVAGKSCVGSVISKIEMFPCWRHLYYFRCADSSIFRCSKRKREFISLLRLQKPRSTQ